jgi:hypothetical protein
MGYYIEAPTDHGKADYLVTAYGAEMLPFAPTWDEHSAIICVVNNGFFEAAALCYSATELADFNNAADRRHKTWLRMDKTTAHNLAGYHNRA